MLFLKDRTEKIVLSVRQDEKTIIFSVNDNGVGLNETSLQKESAGQTIINALAQQVSGEIKYINAGQGTTAELHVPISKA